MIGKETDSEEVKMITPSDGFIGMLGERIRFFRVRKKMTQKQLAELCHITEPAIRNYELNNRIPSHETMNNIAGALGISYYTLADPEISYMFGAAHALFKMEYAYQLSPIEVDGKAVLSVIPFPCETETPLFQRFLDNWLKARKMLESGEITKEQYHEWMYQYPVVPVLDDSEDEVIKESDDKIREHVKKKRPRKNVKKPKK